MRLDAGERIVDLELLPPATDDDDAPDAAEAGEE
jgi:hypothetical protein